MGEWRNVYRFSVGRPEKRCYWEDNIKMDLRETGIDEVN
jgi:hypothetical protein